MSLSSGKTFLAVQILGRDGVYPRFAIRGARHRFEASDDLVWMAVLQGPMDLRGFELPEHSTLIPEEIRLQAALTLSTRDPFDAGHPRITLGSSRYEKIIEGRLNLSSEQGQQSIQKGLLQLLTESGKGIKLSAAERSYYVDTRGSEADARSILRRCDAKDNLLMAGLSNMLAAIRMSELEVSALCMFVSMSSALEFIRQRLDAARGLDNTPFAEVNSYLTSVYPAGSEISAYMEEVYKQRIIATHPSSRYGDYWAVPLMVGDIYHLRKHLILIYRHILLGERPLQPDP